MARIPSSQKTKTVKKKSPQSLTENQKERLLVELTKVPVVQIACQRIGVGRATYYSWRESDAEFRKTADKAIYEGNFVINDLAESKLISNIQDGNNTSIIFWLKNHHGGYNEKILHQHEHLHAMEITTEEQEKILKALYNIGYANTIKLNEKEAEDIVKEKYEELREEDIVRDQKLSEKGLSTKVRPPFKSNGKTGVVDLDKFFKKMQELREKKDKL